MAKSKTDDETKPTRPDAVKTPLNMAAGVSDQGRVLSVLEIAEPILQCDKINGEKGFTRKAGNYHLTTRSEKDTEFGKLGTPQAGMPRYHWTDRGDGVLVGHLINREETANAS